MKINPELLPLIEWWEKDGKQTVIYALIALIAVGGWYGWKAHKAAVKEAASAALVNAYTREEIEDAVSKFSGTAASGVLKLRLAKSYFDEGKYDQAMGTYEELEAKAPEGFEDIPPVGKAQCLEAMGKFAEAQKAFDEFAEKNSKSFMALTARLGAARAICQAGDKAAALKRIEALKAEKPDGTAKARIEATELLIKRYVKPAPAKPAVVDTAKSVEAANKDAKK